MSDRPRHVHRLLGVRGRLLRREQHPGGRRRLTSERPRDGLAAHRALRGDGALEGGRIAEPIFADAEASPTVDIRVRADDLPALRRRAVRAGLPRLATYHNDDGLNGRSTTAASARATARTTAPTRSGASTGSTSRYELARAAAAAAQPRRHGARPGRDGEVHLLRAAHPRGAARSRRTSSARSPTARSTTACAQTCPTQAITFGNLKDAESAVAQGRRRTRARYHSLRRAEHAARRHLPAKVTARRAARGSAG